MNSSMLSFDEELERCRKVRSDIDRQHKSLHGALAHLSEISKLRQNGKRVLLKSVKGSAKPSKRSA